MTLEALRIAADGTMLSGPEGWTSALAGTLYTVTHDQDDADVLPAPAPVVPIVPGVGPQSLVTSQLTHVGADSFSWYNVNASGRRANYETVVLVSVPDA